MERQTDRQTDRQMERQTDRQTDGKTDRQTDRWKDRQTYRQTVVLTSCVLSLPALLSTGHYMLYYLTPAIQPRMLVTFDETLSPTSITVRVGQV